MKSLKFTKVQRSKEQTTESDKKILKSKLNSIHVHQTKDEFDQQK